MPYGAQRGSPGRFTRPEESGRAPGPTTPDRTCGTMGPCAPARSLVPTVPHGPAGLLVGTSVGRVRCGSRR